MAVLADLSGAELEAIILDGELEAFKDHGEHMSLQATLRRIPGTEESALELAVSNDRGCFEHTIPLREPYFSSKASIDNHVSGLVKMLCRRLAEYQGSGSGAGGSVG